MQVTCRAFVYGKAVIRAVYRLTLQKHTTTRYITVRPELLNNHRVDLLVWIASIHPEPPPQSDLPTIVFAHPMIAKELTHDLVVPCGVPGIDHTGYSYRTDGVIILPLRKLRDSGLPALHEILRDIQLQLGEQNDD